MIDKMLLSQNGKEWAILENISKYKGKFQADSNSLPAVYKPDDLTLSF